MCLRFLENAKDHRLQCYNDSVGSDFVTENLLNHSNKYHVDVHWILDMMIFIHIAMIHMTTVR